MKIRILSLLLGLMSLAAVSQAEAARIYSPKWNGYALDFCANFEQGCGQPAADLYCRKRGYDGSTGYQIQPAVSYPTMTVGQNAICNPSVHRCDSFAFIDCRENTRTFNYPVHNGYRLDWCRQFEHECGAPAALTFCQRKGFNQLVNFQIQPRLSTATMTIGSNAICNPQFHGCDSFTFIQCRK